MKSTQRNPFTPPCHCSGVARSDSKISAKALYGKKILLLMSWTLLLREWFYRHLLCVIH